jgi:DnaK suppressor protein
MAARKPLDLDRYRTQLTDLRTQLLADLEQTQVREVVLSGGPNEPGPGQHWERSGYGDHQADDATELFEREKSMGMEQTLRTHLDQVEHALARVEEGTYGTCENCGRPIPKSRLDAMPEATLCINCKNQAEARQPVGRRYEPGSSS